MRHWKGQRGFSLLNAALVMTLATTGSAGALVYSAGAIRVQVHEKHEGGENINLIIPAIIVPIGMSLAPEDMLLEVSEEMRQVLPIIKAASAELARIPDGVLVEVRDRNDHVLIQKRGGLLVIDVESRDEEVHVSFPISMVVAMASRLEAMQPGPEETFEYDAEMDEDWDLAP